MDRSYYLYFFSPSTWKIFSEKGFNTGGVRNRQRNTLKNNLKEGDYLIVFCSKFSRFLGILEFKGRVREEGDNPYFTEENDPFIWRFDVERKKFIDFKNPEMAIPQRFMLEKIGLIDKFKKTAEIGDSTDGQILVRTFASFFGQGSLRKIEDKIAEEVINIFENNKEVFPINEKDRKKLDTGEISEDEEIVDESKEDEYLENKKDSGDTHHKMQANLVELGEKWKYKVWVPNNDRERVKNLGNFNENVLLDDLPMAFDESAKKIIKNIDVIWTKAKSMEYAFEVEHTTGVTSGLLRLNDLELVLPNLKTKFIIVADYSIYNKFNREINRPSFEKTILDKTGFLSYESFANLLGNDDIEFMDSRKLDDILD